MVGFDYLIDSEYSERTWGDSFLFNFLASPRKGLTTNQMVKEIFVVLVFVTTHVAMGVFFNTYDRCKSSSRSRMNFFDKDWV